MKYRPLISYSFIIVFSFSGSTFAQPAAAARHSYQQRWISSFLEGNKSSIGKINSIARIDSLFLVLQNGWAEEANKIKIASLPQEITENLDSYRYEDALRQFKYPETLASICHCWENYSLPALQKDFNYFSKEPSADKALIIWTGASIGTYLNIFHCPLSKEKFEILSRQYSEMFSVIDSYIEVFRGNNDQIKRFKRMRLELFDYRIGYDLLNLIYANKLENALEKFALQARLKSTETVFLAKPARELANSFHRIGNEKYARVTLDILSENTLRSDLSADTLDTWYKSIGMVNRQSSPSATSILFPGSKIADLNGKLLDLSTNQVLDLQSIKGKYIIIDFWHTACKPCIEEIPELIALSKEVNKSSNFIFLSVSADQIETKKNEKYVKDWMTKRGVTYPVLWDTIDKSIVKKFNVYAYPTKIVIDPNGRTMKKANGSEITISNLREFISQN